MSSYNPAKAAEKITDEEILRRIEKQIEAGDAPFLTTNQADAAIEELKDDQVRRRLKSLANDKQQLSYAHPRGLVFWLPEDIETPGEISLDPEEEQQPDWESIDIDDLPQNLVEDAAEAYTEETTTSKQIYDIGKTMNDGGLFLLSLGIFGILADDFVMEGSLSSTQQNLFLALLGMGFIAIAVAGSLIGISKISAWAISTKWGKKLLEAR